MVPNSWIKKKDAKTKSSQSGQKFLSFYYSNPARLYLRNFLYLTLVWAKLNKKRPNKGRLIKM